jgi:hypothetical protein
MNDLDHPRTGSAFRGVLVLVGCYAGLCVLTLVAAVLLRDHHKLVTDAVWVRGTIVLASSLLTLAFALRAARGSRRAYLRLRIVTAVMVVAIAVIVSLPGLFPAWMRIEQGCCGLLLLGTVVLVNRRRLRALYAAK